MDNHGEELLIGHRLAYRRAAGATDITVTSFAPNHTRGLHGVDADLAFGSQLPHDRG